MVRGMAVTALEDDVDHLFEGDFLLPRHAAELRESWAEAVRASFLGYAEIGAEEKRRQISVNGGGPND